MKGNILAALALMIGAAQLVAGGTILEIDRAASSIEIEGKALGFIPANFVVEEFDATIALQERTLELKGAEIALAYDTLTSGAEARDRKIRDWLEADRYPNGSFRLQRTERIGDERFAIGTLRLHGQSGEARFQYDTSIDGKVVTVRAKALIDYRKWGLPVLRVLFFKVRPELEIRLELVGDMG